MPGLFDLDLPDNTNNIQVNKPVKKKKATKKKILDIHDVEEITLGGMLGDKEFEVRRKAKQLESDDEDSSNDLKKLLKSKRLSLADRLAIINENVLKVLGKQVSNVLVIKDRKTFHEYISDCIAAGRIDIDTETNNSLDPVTCKLMGPCFYAPGLKQAYVPLNHRNPETKERLSWQLTEKDVKEELQRVLDSKIKIIMHNGKFDLEVIYCTCGIWVPPYWDTMIAARLLDENERAGLKEQYIKYIDPTQTKYDIEGLFTAVQYADVDPDIFALYAATDSFMTDKLYERQLKLFGDPDLQKLYNNVFMHLEMPVLEVTASMELYGVNVDTALGARLKDKYTKQLADLDASIAKQLDSIRPLILDWKLTPEANEKTRVYVPKKTKMTQEKLEQQYPYVDESTGARYKIGKARAEQLEDPVNLASPAQLAIIFYDVFQCEPVSKKNERATGESELKALYEALSAEVARMNKNTEVREFDEQDLQDNMEAGVSEDDSGYAIKTEHVQAAADLCGLILKRRGLMKLLTTYIDVIPALTKHWPDGRVRFHLSQLGTDTGRYSSGGKLKFMEDKVVSESGYTIPNIQNCFRVDKDAEVCVNGSWQKAAALAIGDLLDSDTIIADIKEDNNQYLVYVKQTGTATAINTNYLKEASLC